MLSVIKKKLKKINVIYRPYRLAKRLYSEILFIIYIARSKGLDTFTVKSFSLKKIKKQKPTEIEIDSLPNFSNFENMVAWLKSRNIEFYEGGHTIYLPPQQVLWELFYPLFSLYPKDIGLKILKDFKKPEESRYVSKEIKPNHLKSYTYVMSRPLDLMRIANYLFLIGLGPKIYDLVQIKIGPGFYTAYVIQHISGREPCADEWADFLDTLKQEFHKNVIMPKNRNWSKHADFRTPDCYRNVIRSKTDKKLYYLDFQAFVFCNEKKYLAQLVNRIKKLVHFGAKRWIRGGNYLYQSIFNITSGKRDTSFRWQQFKKMMGENKIDIKGKVVFDIGCNAGMMLHCALTEGVFWAIGWDKKEVACSADLLLSALGDTRYNVFGRNIFEDTDFFSDIPEYLRDRKDGILLFLAMRKHIGFPEGIARLPIKYIIYEGHQDETMADMKVFLEQIRPKINFQILQNDEYKDGDSQARPIAILERL